MTSPITKDNQFILNLQAESVARLTQGQERKREIEEEVFFVKKKKKKANKNVDVIILDHDNNNSKAEEVVQCVKCEVTDSKDQITPIEDKNKRESHLKPKKKNLEIQNCEKKTSEVNREKKVKNNNGYFNHKVDVYSESSIYSKMGTEKRYLNKQKENTNRLMTIDNENCNNESLNKYEDVKNINFEVKSKKNEVKKSKKNNTGRGFINEDIEFRTEAKKRDGSTKVDEKTSTVLLTEKRKFESDELNIAELSAISAQHVQSAGILEPKDNRHPIWTPKSEENVNVKVKDKPYKTEMIENMSKCDANCRKVIAGRKLKPSDDHILQSKNVNDKLSKNKLLSSSTQKVPQGGKLKPQDCEHRTLSVKNGEDVARKDKLNDKSLLKDKTEGKQDKPGARHMKKGYSGVIRIKFSLEEDQIILAAMEKYGDRLSLCKLAKNIGRLQSSVTVRVAKLKAGSNKVEAFTIVEDKVIMDMALDFVEKNGDLINLECNIPNHKWMEFVKQLQKRLATSLRKRWEHHLKPWILQHRAGTLNLDITRMLANYLSDNFQDIASIDWPSVAAKKEFSGHTESSLRSVFFNTLLTSAQKTMKAVRSSVTLEDIVEVANYSKKRNSKVKEERQQEVIKYYEKWMENSLR